MQRSTDCPANYHELYEKFFPMIRGIVAKAGIDPHDVEDVSMDILTRFIERDGISWYDPEKVHDVTQLSWEGRKVGHVVKEGPRFRTASFRGMLRQFVVLSVRHHLDKQNNRKNHEPFRLDHPMSDDDGNETTWVETNAIPWPSCPTEATVEVYDAIFSAKRLRETRVTEALKVAATQEAEAQYLERKCRQRALWEARRSCRKRIKEAFRREQAVLAAASIAQRGERVTGSSVARECGWSRQIGVEMLRNARDDLKVSGL